jgi:signal transduction histidine kinase
MIRRAQVLIVDDDPDLLQALSEALQLRLRGVVVETAESALRALEQLGATDYDAIVADIRMPGMDGIELLRRIREVRPDTPTLLITGHGEHDLAIEALRIGAQDYVQKPIDREYFVGSLSHAIERRRLNRKVAANRQRLERHSRELEDCLDERTRELRELYRREALARAELEAAQQRQHEMVSLISHELATPLTTVRGYLQMLNRSGVDGSFRERARDIMLSETGRMQRLVRDLVGETEVASGGLSLRIERCDLASVAREQIEAASTRSRRHTLVLDAPKHLETECDGERMAQVFANLLANALTYSNQGEVRLTLRRDGQNAHVSVRDEGPGIPKEKLDSVFEPRVRLEPRRRRDPGNGKGLGLSIAREIVESHDGRIWAESDAGKGTTFHLALPLARPSSARTSSARVDKLVAESAASHQSHTRRRGSKLAP